MPIFPKKVVNALVDVIFPPRCPICNDITNNKIMGICDNCSPLISYVEEPYCMKCGKPVQNEEEELCRDCASKMHMYEEGRAATIYDEYMRMSLYRFKYNNKPEYARTYAKIIFDKFSGKIFAWKAEALVPVPVHKDKLKKRGYNQAELVARELSRLTQIPVRSDLVMRFLSTQVQKNLGAKERENNLKKAFKVTSNSVKLKAVIIVDDIYTTGSTIDAVASVLKRSGVERVYYLSVSIGRGY